ncbi:MAG: hypothetical protein Q9166_004393 [cf. Caloplaca sp. 2 TL-2023]
MNRWWIMSCWMVGVLDVSGVRKRIYTNQAGREPDHSVPKPTLDTITKTKIPILPTPIIIAMSNQENKGVLGGVTDTLGKTVGGVTDTAGNAVSGLGNTVGDTTKGLTDTVGNTTKGVGNTAKSGVDSAGNYASGATGGSGGNKQSAQNPLGLSE